MDVPFIELIIGGRMDYVIDLQGYENIRRELSFNKRNDSGF